MVGLVRMLVAALLLGVAPAGFAAVSVALTNGETKLLTQGLKFVRPEIGVTLFGIKTDGTGTSKSHKLRELLLVDKKNIILLSDGETRVLHFATDDLGAITRVIVDVNYPVQFAGLRTISYTGSDKIPKVEQILNKLVQAASASDSMLKTQALADVETAGVKLSTFIDTPTSIKEGATYEADSGLRISTPNDTETHGKSGALFTRIEPNFVARGDAVEKDLPIRGVVLVDALDSQVAVTATYSTAYTVSASTQITDAITTGGKSVFSAKGSTKLGDVGFEASTQVETQSMQSTTVQTTNASSLLSTQTNTVTVAAGTLQVLVLNAVLRYTETPLKSTLTGAWYLKNDIQQASGAFSRVGAITFKPGELRDAEWCSYYARLVIESQGAAESQNLLGKMAAKNILSREACTQLPPTHLQIRLN